MGKRGRVKKYIVPIDLDLASFIVDILILGVLIVWMAIEFKLGKL